MTQGLRKTLLVTIAALLGVIVGIVAALLTHFGGGQMAEVIRDGGVGFAAATTFVLVVLAYLGAV